MASLKFSNFDWRFVAGIFISKTVLFFISIAAVLVFARGKPRKLAAAGIVAIFTTQSNDFALGLPVIEALFA